MILGIEEFLDRPLLSYVNELGYIAFIYLSLVFCGCIKRSQIDYQKIYDSIYKNSMSPQTIFEITQRYGIKLKEELKMEPEFTIFLHRKKS